MGHPGNSFFPQRTCIWSGETRPYYVMNPKCSSSSYYCCKNVESEQDLASHWWHTWSPILALAPWADLEDTHLAVFSTGIGSSWVLGSSFSNSHQKGEFDKVDTEYSFMVRNPSSKKPGIPFIIASHTDISVAGFFLRKDENSMSCTSQKEMQCLLQCPELSWAYCGWNLYSADSWQEGRSEEGLSRGWMLDSGKCPWPLGQLSTAANGWTLNYPY